MRAPASPAKAFHDLSSGQRTSEPQDTGTHTHAVLCLRLDHLPRWPLGSLKTYWGRAECLISKLSTELAPEGSKHKYPLNNNADMHWTVSNKYIPEIENTHLLNAAGAKDSMNVIRCNDEGC